MVGGQVGGPLGEWVHGRAAGRGSALVGASVAKRLGGLGGLSGCEWVGWGGCESWSPERPKRKLQPSRLAPNARWACNSVQYQAATEGFQPSQHSDALGVRAMLPGWYAQQRGVQTPFAIHSLNINFRKLKPQRFKLHPCQTKIYKPKQRSAHAFTAALPTCTIILYFFLLMGIITCNACSMLPTARFTSSV